MESESTNTLLILVQHHAMSAIQNRLDCFVIPIEDCTKVTLETCYLVRQKATLKQFNNSIDYPFCLNSI